MKKVKLLSVIALVLTFFLSSCLVTKTNVGSYKEAQGKEYTYAKGKQLWLFWGLLPLGRTNVNTPKNGQCKVITHYTFSDFLISTLTVGVLTSYSVKIKAKKAEN